MKSNAWYAKFPLDAYALGPFRFAAALNEKEFRKHLREWGGYNRLTGVQIWTA